MSGYRAFSAEFVRRVPVVSKGFEVETELTLQALYRDLAVVEIPIPYGERPTGSVSKLRTFRDGAKVLIAIFDIAKAYRPLMFFTLLATLVALVGVLLGLLPTIDYLRTGSTSHLPLAIASGLCGLSAVVFVVCGLILDSIKHHFKELSQLVLKTNRRDRQ
jgi:hypothetical protein